MEKRNSVAARYAVRFQTLSLLENFANSSKVEATSATMGIWKLTGIPAESGLAGALAFLQTQQWTNVDILYIADAQTAFLSDSVGNIAPMHCQFNGIFRGLEFKATNAKAKQTPKDANISSKAASASAARVLVPRSKEREAFIAKVLPKTPLQQPAPPRVLEQNKREWGLTSEIPDSKRGRF